MLFSTFYFSGTGNTEWAAKKFCTLIHQKEHQADLYSIADALLTDDAILKVLEDSDYIGFAYPIYGADLPAVMRDFISRITNILRDHITLSKPIFLIQTFGVLNGYGLRAARSLFANTYLRIAGCANIRLCMNVSSPVLFAVRFDQELLNRRKADAGKRLELLADHLLAEQEYVEGNGLGMVFGPLIRKISREPLKETYKSLGVNPKTCTGCLKCVKECPTNSISLHHYVFSPTCTGCMRCYNFCPTYSITIDGIYADPQKYRRYQGPGE